MTIIVIMDKLARERQEARGSERERKRGYKKNLSTWGIEWNRMEFGVTPRRNKTRANKK